VELRVITGKAKGRRLNSVPGDTTRPLTDRAKSALFSILGSPVRDSHFLDLFAGTGQVGIEALSRGAASAVFVEQAPEAVQTIRENLQVTHLAQDAQIAGEDVFTYLARPSRPFDYVYVAPPYHTGMWQRTLAAIDAAPDWLVHNGWAIVQMDPKEYEATPLDNLVLFDQRIYSRVMLCFYGRLLDPSEAADL
jgi:16S rRNA (guanine(966)-N(2))-methyltransferase RsmD